MILLINYFKISDIIASNEEIKLRLKELKVEKSPGIDEIYAYVLKECASRINITLKIYNNKYIINQ